MHTGYIHTIQHTFNVDRDSSRKRKFTELHDVVIPPLLGIYYLLVSMLRLFVYRPPVTMRSTSE